MNSRQISFQILIPILICAGLTIASLTGYSIYNQNQLVKQSELDRLNQLSSSFLGKISEREQMSLALAYAFAEIPDVQEAFSRQDRDALAEMLALDYEFLNEQFDIPQAQFHLAPATSFLRLHKLDSFGDDLSSFRMTVIAANKEKRAISGLEEGKGGFGIRGVVPVNYQGEQIGSFEMGMNFDQNILIDFKNTYGVDTSVLLYNEASKVDSFAEEAQADQTTTAFSVLTSTLEETIDLPESALETVYQDGISKVYYRELGDIPYAILLTPIRDYSGDTIGILQIILDRSQSLAQIGRNQAVMLGIGGGLLLALALLTQQIVSRRLVIPLRNLVGLADQVTSGRVDIEFKQADRNDEVGLLSQSFQKTVNRIQELALVAQRLSEGDLTVSVNSQGEQDVLGYALQTMLANLKTIVGRLQEVAMQVDGAAQQMNTFVATSNVMTAKMVDTLQDVTKGISQESVDTGQTARSVEQVVQAINGVSLGAQEQAGAVDTVSKMAQKISMAVQQVAYTAQTGSTEAQKAAHTASGGYQKVKETITGMELIHQKVNVSAEKVEEMGSNSAKIEAILITIEEIASQTNLLALNAAIESARAGEYGKGFAVVADEVRKLAERSASAVKEINSLVKTINSTVGDAVGAMRVSAAEVNLGVERANLAGKALEEIIQAVSAVKVKMALISDAASDMHSSSDGLVMAMGSVSAVVEENTATMEEMSASASEMNIAVSRIAQVSNENSAAIQDIASTSVEMRQMTEKLLKESKSLAGLAGSLQSVAGQFTVAISDTQN